LRREASYGFASEDQRHNSRFTRRPGIGGPDRSPPFMPGQLRGQRRYAHLQAPLRSNRDDHAGLGKRRAPGEPPRRSCMSPRSLTSSGPSENPFGLRVPARHMMICSHHLSSGAMTGGPPVDAGKSGRRRTLLQIRSVGLISGLAGFVRPFGRRLGRLPEIDPSRCNRIAHPRADYARRSDRFAHGAAHLIERWSMVDG
jgi:hypothetical protein